jgi:rRNA maturation endonuclease Nob1
MENVRDFARKTGDIGSLSDQDIGIIALAYRFYMTEGLKDCLRTNP